MKFHFSSLRNIAIAGIMVYAGPAHSQGSKLGFGDPAPRIQVKWVKGTPLNALDKDKAYVLEFWATWCGPCRAAMPHISELARRYSGKVVFIGVNVFEKIPAGASYDSCYPAVKTFVDEMGDRMAYNVAMDGNETQMAKEWMGAAGLSGIPATFVVKDGRIAWIGHPKDLDKVLERISAGSYDSKSEAQQYVQEADRTQKTMAPFLALNKAVTEAMATKDYTKALTLIEANKDKVDPVFQVGLANMKFVALIKLDVPKALAYARSECKTNVPLGSSMAMVVLAEESLPPEAYRFAEEQLRGLMASPGPKHPMVYHMIATCRAKLGDIPGAVASEEQAIEAGNKALESDLFKGQFTTATLQEYLAALKGYQAMSAAIGKQ